MANVSLLRRSFFPDDRARVAVHRETRQPPIPQHGHEFLELAVVISGEAVHHTGRFQHRIQAGDVLVISRVRRHGYERTQGLNLLNILVREDSLARIARDLRRLPGYHALFALEHLRWSQQSYGSRLRLNAGDLAQIAEWASRIEDETARRKQGGHVLAEAYLVLILGLLVRRYNRPSPLAPRPEAGMGRLLSWIEIHLGERITIASLAREAGMSVRSFQRHFRAKVGEPPLGYVLRQRINRAKEMLGADPAVRIDEIATQCGFDDSNYFSRAFRQRTGASPRRYAAKLARRRAG